MPYLLVYPPTRDPQWRRGEVLPKPETGNTSGFEADLSRRDDRPRPLEGLAAPFLKALASKAAATASVGRGSSAEGTISTCPIRTPTELSFGAGDISLPAGHLGRPDVACARFPRRSGRGLSPVHATPPPALVPVQFEKRPQRTAALALSPDAARAHACRSSPSGLDVGSTYVFRRAAVTEARLTAWQAEPVTIGRSALVREGAAGGCFACRD